MPFPLIPVIGATVIGAVAIARAKGKPQLSKQEQEEARYIYVDAMMSRGLTGEYYRNLAKTYKDKGMVEEAKMLIKRAELSEASPELKAARKEAFRKAFLSTDIDAIRQFANVCEEMGALGACASLRERANGLMATQGQQPETLEQNDGH